MPIVARAAREDRVLVSASKKLLGIFGLPVDPVLSLQQSCERLACSDEMSTCVRTSTFDRILGLLLGLIGIMEKKMETTLF